MYIMTPTGSVLIFLAVQAFVRTSRTMSLVAGREDSIVGSLRSGRLFYHRQSFLAIRRHSASVKKYIS